MIHWACRGYLRDLGNRCCGLWKIHKSQSCKIRPSGSDELVFSAIPNRGVSNMIGIQESDRMCNSCRNEIDVSLISVGFTLNSTVAVALCDKCLLDLAKKSVKLLKTKGKL